MKSTAFRIYRDPALKTNSDAATKSASKAEGSVTVPTTAKMDRTKSIAVSRGRLDEAALIRHRTPFCSLLLLFIRNGKGFIPRIGRKLQSLFPMAAF